MTLRSTSPAIEGGTGTSRPWSQGAWGLEEAAGILLPQEHDRSQPDQPDDAREDPGRGGLRPADPHVRRSDEQRQGAQAEQHRPRYPRPVPAAPTRPGHQDPQPDAD